MKTRIITIMVLCIFTSLNVFPQQYKNRGKDCKLDNEKMHSEKIAFLSSEIDLSVSEAQQFWPIYNEFNEELDKLFNSEREINRELKINLPNLSDKEISDKLNKLIQIKIDRADLESKYHKKFCEVLPIDKVAMLYKSDREFRKHLLHKYKGYNNRE
ncbi:MAG: hypothetical protein GX793_05270 [Bacteroidales bacterium]|nr:hypothetical protein [Bacteroidales bacterium]MCK9499702.1 hypothetical protein [Bacteroidales bacterium]MDY0314643.1 hypothetical protein [Bacteroidales bacterium]NLB86453.1 hypothetical protein [Bacteroidales bacterium]